MSAASRKFSVVGGAVEVSNAQMEKLLHLQRDVLEMIALGCATEDIFDQLCLLSEAMVPNSVGSIMVLNNTHSHLDVRFAPSIPAGGVDALNALLPGLDAGSFGTEVYHRNPVYVEHILTDRRWSDLQDVAEQFNLNACWSMPIKNAGDEGIGSFTLISFECRPPGPFHKRLLETGSYLAGIVLERADQAHRLFTAEIAFDHMREAVMVTDAQHRIIQVNQAFEHITGYGAEEAIGHTPRLLNSGRQTASFYRDFFRALEEQGEWRGEIWNRRKNGDIYPQWLSIKAVYGTDSTVSMHVSVFADINDTKDSDRQLWQLAHHDALSNLPNRLLLSARLEHAIQRSHRTSTKLALLFIDLDRFKKINDSLGHQAGDELLQEVSQRLLGAVHEDDTVARLGGDEFVVLVEDVPDANITRHIANRIIDCIAEPVMVRGKSLDITASIGISLYPGDAQDPATMLQHADAAMYQAKALGRNQHAFYAPSLTHEIQQRLELEFDLRQSLANGQFSLHYQPQFASSDGRLIAVEVLLRWKHPRHGLVPPSRFIPVAEETGLIREIGCWVIDTACNQAMQWRADGFPMFTLAVNLSPYQLRDECARELMAVVNRTGFPPEWFEFEVTEALLVEDGGRTLQQLTEMREHLVMRIALDDFGTGHFSLSQLNSLPIVKLKIDSSFVSALPDDTNAAAIVRAIIQMAHTLGLEVVAEGVETQKQHRFLCQGGCDYLQGFFYARPMPAKELSRVLEDGQLEIKHTFNTH